MAENNYNTAESAEQDQTARMCWPILLYALRKRNLWPRTAGSIDFHRLCSCFAPELSILNI